MNITLSPGVLDALTAHAVRGYPEEACGLIAGHGTFGERFLPAENVLASPTAYEMSPAWLASTFRALRESGEELVAIMHSHPSGAAVPSRRDIAQAYDPSAAHVIVSLVDREHPKIRAFRIASGEVIEIELHAIV